MSDATLRVIQKLLSRAEATDFESERESCLAKVAELMARHSIEEALVWAAAGEQEAGTEQPTERLLVVPAPYAARKVSLFGAVGEHAGCTVIDVGSEPDGVRRVAAVGFPGDLDRMEMLVTSLLVQLTRSMLAGGPRRGARRGSPGATAAWRRSFISGFTARVAERLADARRTEAAHVADQRRSGPAEAPDQSLALVLVAREEAVDAEVSRRYPYLRSRRMDAGSSRSGHSAGRDAGSRAGLGEAALRGARALTA